MSANLSLAFQWRGHVDDLARLDAANVAAGLVRKAGDRREDGTRTSSWELAIDGEAIDITCRCYDRDPWVSTTMDIDEDRFDEVAARVGRQQLVDRCIRSEEHT